MAKKRVFKNSLTLNIVIATTLLLIVFGIIVAAIGYTKFNETLTERYNDAAYTTAISTRQFISGEDVEYYFAAGKAIYDEHGKEIYNEYYAQYGDALKKDKNIWKQYVAAVENYLPNDAPEYRRDKYRSIKANLQAFCENQEVAILYIVIPISDDYTYYCSVVDCVNATYLPYNEWVLGENGESQKHPADSEYNKIYKNIMTNGLERATVAVKKPSNGATPYINSLVPIYKGEGANKEVVGIIVVQQTMTLLNQWGISYTVLIAMTTLILSVVSVFAYILLVRKQFITPIRTIMAEAQRFAAENSEPETPLDDSISRIEEISSLSQAIGEMEYATLQYMDTISQAASDKQRIVSELQIAQQIQAASLPSNFPAFPNRREFDLYASMRPAKQVGGDFYDFFLIDDDHLALVIADVSGKGIPASLFMMVTKILINERALSGGSPANILEMVNKRICQHNEAEMFVTVWLGILEISTGKLTAANAGHDNPAVSRNGKFEFVKSKRGLVIGAMEDAKYTDFEIDLSKGDKLFLFTDGVPEATDPYGTMLTLPRTLQVLNDNADKSPKEILDSINDVVEKFMGDAPRFDDTTMLCVEYLGTGEQTSRRISFKAEMENLPKVNTFVTNFLQDKEVSKKAINQLLLAIEEIFANIVNYAYPDGAGDVNVIVSIENNVLKITFKDKGVAYDPLERNDPDVSLNLNERKEGGLGVFITKKLVDNINYERKNDQNILTLEKKL
ncbi:MAG: SpoIIE family protein phosphatase [Clostridia bacterium]|nr:SpoIIE family protein phosphatase [Clostridia bacterium]